jgi:hypothetical protein
MKKSTILILVIIGFVVIGLFIFSYPIIFFLFSSSNCGNEFNKAFNDAVKDNNISFCSKYTGDIKWGKDWGYGIGCNLKRDNMGIRKNNFEDSCLCAMAYSTNNIEFCKFIQEENSKGSCVLGIARNKGDISYCEVLEKTNGYYGPCIGNNKYKP